MARISDGRLETGRSLWGQGWGIVGLLVLLSAFYIPAAVDPQRHRAVAWLAVLARLAGVAFFVGLQPREYHLFGYFDLTFFVPEAALLASIASPSAARGLKPTPYESPWRL